MHPRLQEQGIKQISHRFIVRIGYLIDHNLILIGLKDTLKPNREEF